MVKGYKYFQSLCLFLVDVVCPFRTSVDKRRRFSVVGCCSKCSRYAQFVDGMEREEEEFFEEVEEIRKHGYAYVDKKRRGS